MIASLPDLTAKRAEWAGYQRHVSPWEIERYLAAY